MPSFDFEVEFEVYCACGKGLCNQSETNVKKGKRILTIEPCDDCLNKSYDRGYDKGYSDGYSDGENNR